MPETKLPRGMYVAPFTVHRPEKASQTLLNKISSCPYSGALYEKHKRTAPQSHQAARGEAIHAAIEAITNLALEQADSTETVIAVPPEIGKDYMQAILEERVDLALPPAEHEACRIALWNYAANTRFDTEAIVGVEVMLEVEVGGFVVRGKIDRCEIANGQGFIRDVKTGLGYPSQEAHENSFQQQFYGLLLLEGTAEGETTPLGKGLSGVHLIEEYPRITGADGQMFTRHAYKDRAQVHDFRRTLEAALAKLDHGVSTGEWKATPGSHCQFCPARGECPIPREELPPDIATAGQAAEVGARIIVLEDELKDLKKHAKAYVEENEPIEVGDQIFHLVATETESPRSKDDIKAAIRQGGLNPDDYYKTTRGMRFKREKRKAA